MVSDRCINTDNVSIIIVDIAPRIPGGLMHFNWPRLLCDGPVYRVYHKTYHNMVKYVYCVNWEMWKYTFSLG